MRGLMEPHSSFSHYPSDMERSWRVTCVQGHVCLEVQALGPGSRAGLG